jgi:hypothetical protein
VYKAEDTRLKRKVALKFLPPKLSREPAFTHEASRTALRRRDAGPRLGSSVFYSRTESKHTLMAGEETPTVPRLAVLPFSNLRSDPRAPLDGSQAVSEPGCRRSQCGEDAQRRFHTDRKLPEGSPYRAAERSYRKPLSLNPGLLSAIASLSSLYTDIRKTEEAFELAQSAKHS